MRKRLSMILIGAVLLCTSLPVSAEEFEKTDETAKEAEDQRKEDSNNTSQIEPDNTPEEVPGDPSKKDSTVLPEEPSKSDDTIQTEEPENKEESGGTEEPEETGESKDTPDVSCSESDDEVKKETKEIEYKAALEAKHYDLGSDTIEVRMKSGNTEFVYTGFQIKPEVEVVYHAAAEDLEKTEGRTEENEKLIAPECYKIEYLNNVKTGEASIVLTGKDGADQESAQTEEKEADRKEDTYTGTKTLKFKITPADIKKCKLQTAKTVDYTGKQVKPKVTLSYQGKNLVLGKDYKAAYSNNKKMGTAVIRINGIGNFKGSRTVKFQIKFGTPVVKTTSSYSKINLKWKKVAAASGYVVYRSTSPKGKFKKIYTCKSGSKVSYSDKKANFGKTYYYKVRAYRNVKVKVKKKTKTKQEYSAWSAAVSENRKLGVVTIKSAKCSAETKAKVTWKKEAGAQGYEIYKSEAKEGKYVYAGKVKGAGKVSYTAKKLKPGVAYYFKVRAFRKSGSKTYYGGLSAVKKETFSDGQKLYTLFPGGVPTTKAEMEQYLVTITVPIKDAEGMPGTMQLRVHRALEKKFMKAFQEMYAVGFPVRAEDTDTYNWRSMASGRNRSHHSYGCVVDLNWNSNPMIGVTEGKYKPGIDPYSITPQVVAIWKKQGFYWGGNWKSTKDYMHFTYTNH